MRLFSELRRRNVLRMAALYVVAAWLVVQVAGTLADLSVLPEGTGPWIMAVLAVGFPIALVVSWFFEVTPEGLSLEKDVPEGQSITRVTGRRMDFVIIAILSAGLIMFAGDKWWPRGPQELTVAVLAFENMSADPEQEYFSDGISEEILNLLAQIKGRKVIARQSSFSFKGKQVDIATMAEQLNVRHVLEGSVRRSGDRVRITAQLIDAKDSSHLWSQTYDRAYDAANLFHIQSEIARAITNRLHMTLTGQDEARLARVPTENTEAYTAYLIGRDRLRDRKVEGLKDAVEQFAKAIELDPKFAGAYSGLADACSLYEIYSGGFRDETCPSSASEREQLARKALELDPESGEAWISLAAALAEQEDGSPESMPKFREAIAAFERGLELNPSHSQGYHWYGMALRMVHLYPDPPSGWIEAWKAGVWESVFRKGLEVDPLSIPLHYMMTLYPLDTRSKEEAIRHGQRMVEIAPDSPRGYETVGDQAWRLKGRIDEFVRWESQAMEIDPQHPSFARGLGLAYSALGDPNMALAYFDLAKALTAPDNQYLQNRLLVEQAFIWLVSGQQDAREAAELCALLGERLDWVSLGYCVYVDLALGQPADALARIEKFRPECLGARDHPEDSALCPTELVRVYQALGDDAAARGLGDVMAQENKTWSDGYPDPIWRLDYAAALATNGRSDEALDVLENLVTSGWRGSYLRDNLPFTLCCDVSFDAIRDHERFQALVATIEADMAQQLENVRAMQQRGEVPALEDIRALIAARQKGD